MATENRITKPWYGDGLRFGCTECGACCTGEPGDVFVDRDEIEALAAHLGMTADEFSASHLRAGRKGVSLVEREDGDCILLGPDRRCIAYSSRPAQCGSWPFWRENLRSRRAWDHNARSCPGMDWGRLHNISEIEERTF